MPSMTISISISLQHTDPQAAKSTPTSPGATAMPPASMKRGVEKSGHAPAKRTKASASKQKYQSPSSSQ